MDITSFLPLITGALGGATSAGVFKGPIQTLEDLWYINYGYKSSDKAARLREKQAINIEKMRDETIVETVKIDPNNIQEPKLNIIGPALEASKYYINEEELRIMFAKIVASSMDKSKNEILHPSFIEILKQLNETDVAILESLKPLSFHSHYPIKKIVARSITETSIFRNIVPMIAIFEKLPYYNSNANSIYNLERLGLIKIHFDITTDIDKFNKIYDDNTTLNTVFNNLTKKSRPEENIEYEKGSIILTNLGYNFLAVCSPSE